LKLYLMLSLLLAPPQNGPASAPDQLPGAGAPAAGVEVPASGAEDPTSEVEREPVSRYPGRFAEGVADVQRLALEGDVDGALAVSDALLVPGRIAGMRARAERATGGASERALEELARPLAWLGVPAHESANRAEVHYLRGLIYAQRADLGPSDESFELARVLAGAGETRLDAIYNQGNLDMLLGEAVRQMIPEIAGEDAVEPPEDMEEDPLAVARSAYLAAREHYVERLTADWRDADTRANAELALRRLNELDEV